MRYNRLMSHLDVTQVKALAKLANLKLTDDEAKEYPEKLSASLDYVENLNELDVSQVPDSFFTTNAHNVMQEDVVDESIMLSQEEALKNAKATKKGYFVVKRIL